MPWNSLPTYLDGFLHSAKHFRLRSHTQHQYMQIYAKEFKLCCLFACFIDRMCVQCVCVCVLGGVYTNSSISIQRSVDVIRMRERQNERQSSRVNTMFKHVR